MIKGLDIGLFPSELRERIETWETVTDALVETRKVRREAGERVRLAAAEDTEALAHALVAGKTVAVTAEKKARAAEEDAIRLVTAHERAAALAEEQLTALLGESKVEYKALVDEALVDAQTTARAALDTLAGALARVEALRAHHKFLEQPKKWLSTGVTVSEPKAPGLVKAVQVLINAERPKATQAEWGIPAALVPDDGHAYALGGAARQAQMMTEQSAMWQEQQAASAAKVAAAKASEA